MDAGMIFFNSNAVLRNEPGRVLRNEVGASGAFLRNEVGASSRCGEGVAEGGHKFGRFCFDL
jgi:hypothetical protein